MNLCETVVFTLAFSARLMKRLRNKKEKNADSKRNYFRSLSANMGGNCFAPMYGVHLTIYMSFLQLHE
jgi:hypothetical protein